MIRPSSVFRITRQHFYPISEKKIRFFERFGKNPRITLGHHGLGTWLEGAKAGKRVHLAAAGGRQPSIENMRILLQDGRTGLFYLGPERWTENPDVAHDFHTGGLALNAARETRLEHGMTLYLFKDPAFNFSVPIQRSSAKVED